MSDFIKLEKYKGVDLMYAKQTGQIHFEFEGERQVKYLFEAYQIIDTPNWEECDLTGYYVEGVFNDHIGIAKATRRNTKNGEPDWKYKGKYDSLFKSPSFGDRIKVYPKTSHNVSVYDEFIDQQHKVVMEEMKLKNIIKKLSPTKQTKEKE